MDKITVGKYEGKKVSVSKFTTGNGIYVWLNSEIVGVFSNSELVNQIDNDARIWKAIEEIHQRVDDLSRKCGKN